MGSSDDTPNTATQPSASAGADRSAGGASGTDSGGGKGAKPSRGQDMGQALRSVYQRTVEESVPDEMLDLLGKLG